MIALGGPKLKLEYDGREWKSVRAVSMIALGGPKLKPNRQKKAETIDLFQ